MRRKEAGLYKKLKFFLKNKKVRKRERRGLYDPGLTKKKKSEGEGGEFFQKKQKKKEGGKKRKQKN